VKVVLQGRVEMKRILAGMLALVLTPATFAAELSSLIDDAQKALASYEQIAGCGKDLEPCSSENFKKANMILAISCTNNPGDFVFVRLAQDEVTYGEFRFTRGRPNGVGTRFSVKKPRGCSVLATRRAVHNTVTREIEEVVYTPYSPEIDTKEMREKGIKYLFGVVGEAEKNLYERQVPSIAFPGLPVALAAPSIIAVHLAIVEHIDPKRMRSESMGHLMNEVLVVIAANGTNAYHYATSKQNARGLFQFTKPTYNMLLERYASAGLIEDFITGAEDHVNAAEAALLLFDLDTEGLSVKKKDNFLKESLYWMEYLAASYNGGSGPAQKAMRASGVLSIEKLFRETQGYIKKLRRLYKVLPKSEKDEA